VIVSRKGQTKLTDDPVHDQSKTHAQEHSKG
jgi:hypothetical protein